MVRPELVPLEKYASYQYLNVMKPVTLTQLST